MKANWAFSLVLVAFKAPVLTQPFSIHHLEVDADGPLSTGEHLASGEHRATSHLTTTTKRRSHLRTGGEREGGGRR